MDNKVKELRGRQIPLVKIMQNEANGDITWELEEKIRGIYPHLFQYIKAKFRGRNFYEGRIVTCINFMIQFINITLFINVLLEIMTVINIYIYIYIYRITIIIIINK